MATKKPANQGPIYILKGRVFRSVTLNINPRIRKGIPWIVTGDTSLGDMTKRLREVPLGTLFVINNDATLIGVITTDSAAAEAQCSGGGGGGGDKPPKDPNKNPKACQAECDLVCKERGGCAGISFDPFGGSTKCVTHCNDDFKNREDEPIEVVLF